MKPLQGSERAPMAGASDVGAADPRERLEASVVVRRRNAAGFAARIQALHSGAGAPFLTREAYADEFGADPKDIAAVASFAQASGLAVVSADAATRTVVLSGTVAKFEAAFAVQLRRFEHPEGVYRGRTGAISVSPELDGVVVAVLGLDDRPQAKPHFRILPAGAAGGGRAGAAGASFTPLQLAQLYDFPAGAGAGQCVGLVELGGGYKPADLKAWFAQLGVAPEPSVIPVSVDQAKNAPTGNPDSADGEVMLDIEVVGAVAPQAKIAVYFAPNTDAGFLDAVKAAVHDTVNKPSVVSISWGGPESSWTGQAMTAFDEALQSAAVMGVTVCIACGDNGSSDGASGDNVDFPASSPHALACGGTSLTAKGGVIGAEVVWDDLASNDGATGGGVSTVFATPAWQRGLSAMKTAGGAVPLAHRGVPDVAGDADPQTGYQVRVDGQSMVIGGTSAVAPLWAGLLARMNALNGGPSGLVQPRLYATPGACHDITSGSNGDFAAARGWDACTGLGSPDGAKVAVALGKAVAG